MQPAIAKRLCTPAAHTGLFGIDNIFVTVNLNERFHYSSFLSVTEWKSQTFYTSQNENVKKLYESFLAKAISVLDAQLMKQFSLMSKRNLGRTRNIRGIPVVLRLANAS